MSSRDARRPVAVLAVLAWGVCAIAAEIDGVRLERDPSSGSALRLTVGVIFPPGQGDSTLGLQVRAFSARVPQGERSQPLRARGREHRDDSGLYRLLGEARRGDGPRGEVAFSVDAQDLDLPPGESRVGLLVLGEGRQEGRSLAAAPAALIEVRRAGRRRPIRPRGGDRGTATATARLRRGSGPRARRLIPRPLEGPGGPAGPLEVDAHPTSATNFAPWVEAGGLGASIESVPAEIAESPDRFAEELRARPHIPLEKAQTDSRKRTLYFATNRGLVPGGSTFNERFSNDLATGNALTFGSVEVNIPVWIDGHYRPPGELTLPGLWNFWKADDPRVFHASEPVILTWEQVRQRLEPQARGQEDDILVMVHGFNNTMEYSALRLAQVANDTGYLGRALLFSWPSAGSMTFYWERMTWTPRVAWAYGRDSEMAERSGRRWPTCSPGSSPYRTPRAAAGRPAPRVHVLAHSMGNRVLLLALVNLRERPEIKAAPGPASRWGTSCWPPPTSTTIPSRPGAMSSAWPMT